MKIILREDIKKLGLAGDVVTVANGFARNYLLPQKFAMMATKFNLKKIDEIKKDSEMKKMEEINLLKATAAKINGVELVFVKKADENDHLFGSVAETDIVDELAKKEISIHKAAVQMEKHIKEIGEFDVEISLAAEISAKIKVKIEKE